MSSTSTAVYTSRSFQDFIVETPTANLNFPGREPTCLADYVYAWLHSGHGARECNGNFQTFTIALIAITDRWLKNPEILDYVPESENSPIVERRVDSVFGDARFRHNILDSYLFAKVVFEATHGNQVK